MFPTLQLEVLERFTAIEQHFRTSRRLRGDTSQTAKGLTFVQIYAIHEYTVKNVVKIAATEIAAHGHAYARLRPSLLALFLEPEVQSLRDCSPNDRWNRRIALLERASSVESVSFSAAPLPTDGTHFRQTHVQLILRVFGDHKSVTIHQRHLRYIDTIVNNRNAVAHGGETAAEVGRRYSRQDIWRYIRRMRSLCLRLIQIVSEYCGLPEKHCR